MYLVYEDKPDLITPEICEFIVGVVQKATNGHLVEVQFRQ